MSQLGKSKTLGEGLRMHEGRGYWDAERVVRYGGRLRRRLYSGPCLECMQEIFIQLLVSVWSIIAELPEMGWQQQNHRTVEALLRRRKLEHSLEPCGQAAAFPDSHCEDTEEEYFDAEDDEEAEDIELDDDAEAELDEICDDDNEMRLELDLSFAAL
ncbi:hypothetical protein EV421DRAFT_1739095 [Armillaria borealis]|uniref:Uncharacterized protein n=1 Tax=Armillaria borealis TaxID=47425 RepID=A0AA39J8X0_9AGAR|nr:hypothetical protein EV421DRAFT_1739095 [Armillaria borealis]